MSDLDALDFGYSIDEVIEGRAAFEKKKKKKEKEKRMSDYGLTNEHHSVNFNFTTKDQKVALDIAAQIEEIISNNKDKLTGHSIHTDTSFTRF